MRESTKVLMALSLLIAFAILILGLWMPDARTDRVWLWLVGAALSAVLVDRKFDHRL